LQSAMNVQQARVKRASPAPPRCQNGAPSALLLTSRDRARHPPSEQFWEPVPAAGHGTAAGRSKASAVGASYSAFDLPIQCLNAAKENTDDARNDALIVTGRKGARSCATFRSTFPPNPPARARSRK